MANDVRQGVDNDQDNIFHSGHLLLTKPYGTVRIVLTGAVVQIGFVQDSLSLLAVVAVAVVRQQAVVPTTAEGIVIVAFQHFAIAVDYRTYAAKMVGHEITGFDTRSCRNKTTAREGAALHRQGSALLAIYQSTRVVKTVARGIRRRELGTYLKDTYNSGKYKTMGTTF